jgi:large subunit ribosomal protein L2
MAIHNIELQPGRGGVLCRSAGVSATLAAREADWAQINCRAAKFAAFPRPVPGHDRRRRQFGSHERRRGQGGSQSLEGHSPDVRGTAMNPIDHPHGGGEGRTKGGRHPVSPKGKLRQGRRHPQASQAVEYARSFVAAARVATAS